MMEALATFNDEIDDVRFHRQKVIQPRTPAIPVCGSGVPFGCQFFDLTQQSGSAGDHLKTIVR
jgi:hypothetical protein